MLNLQSAHPAYPFVATDAGRSSSRRPQQKNDCTVRAIALAKSMSYDDAYDLLSDAGRKSGCRFEFSKWIASQPWATKFSFPAVKGQRRMNPATFCRQHSVGTFIVKTAKHVFVVKDGVAYDEMPAERGDRCIYSAWECICLPGQLTTTLRESPRSSVVG